MTIERSKPPARFEDLTGYRTNRCGFCKKRPVRIKISESSIELCAMTFCKRRAGIKWRSELAAEAVIKTTGSGSRPFDPAGSELGENSATSSTGNGQETGVTKGRPVLSLLDMGLLRAIQGNLAALGDGFEVELRLEPMGLGETLVAHSVPRIVHGLLLLEQRTENLARAVLESGHQGNNSRCPECKNLDNLVGQAGFISILRDLAMAEALGETTPSPNVDYAVREGGKLVRLAPELEKAASDQLGLSLQEMFGPAMGQGRLVVYQVGPPSDGPTISAGRSARGESMIDRLRQQAEGGNGESANG